MRKTDSRFSSKKKNRFPYYFTFKTLFILYLILPSTRGAVVVYDKIFKPTLSAQRRSTPVTTQIQESVTAPQ